MNGEYTHSFIGFKGFEKLSTKTQTKKIDLKTKENFFINLRIKEHNHVLIDRSIGGHTHKHTYKSIWKKWGSKQLQ